MSKTAKLIEELKVMILKVDCCPMGCDHAESIGEDIWPSILEAIEQITLQALEEGKAIGREEVKPSLEQRAVAVTMLKIQEDRALHLAKMEVTKKKAPEFFRLYQKALKSILKSQND